MKMRVSGTRISLKTNFQQIFSPTFAKESPVLGIDLKIKGYCVVA